MGRRQGNLRGGPRPELNQDYKAMVATRGMELRAECKTLRQTTDIINQEFGDTLALTTIAKWIEERIKPELEEKADAYRQHLLEQISIAKEAVWKRVLMGDDKAVGAWTRLLDREMRLTGVEKPVQIAVSTNIVDKETEFEKMLNRLRVSRGDALPDSHVIQGEVVRREEG